MTITQTEPNYGAIENAKSWLGEIDETTSRLDYEGASERDTVAIREAALEAIQKTPVSIGVRSSGFHAVNGETPEPDEFEIRLYARGATELRIIGNLNLNNQPTDCTMEWRHGGTSWTYSAGREESDTEAMRKFASCFYFGDF